MIIKSMTLTVLALAALAFTPQTSMAQTTSVGGGVAVATAGAGAPGKNVFFRTSFLDVAPVKGSPFCATVTNEHTQLFADGNRIHTTEDSTVCRDSQGRTRREAQLNLLGAVPQGSAPKLITIEDPVAGVRYTLDTFAKIAEKMPLNRQIVTAAGKGPKLDQNIVIYQKSGSMEAPPPGAPAPMMMTFTKRIMDNGATFETSGNQTPPTTENLGDQTINGIRATGTRVTTTIPAGQMGNEQPINVVSENWYSQDLKATVMTKHSDPWAGQLTTTFSNVNTSEPDPSLFTVPSDYKVVDSKNEQFMIRLQPPNPPSPPQQ